MARDLMPAAVQEVIERHYEQWIDEFPTLSLAFRRYGFKAGSLGTTTAQGLTALTWAHYMETASGDQFVVIVFLQKLLSSDNAPSVLDVGAFAQQFALDPLFAAKVRDAVAADDERPELVPSILKLKVKRGVKLVLRARVDNASPTTASASTVTVFVSDDGTLDDDDTELESVAIPKLRGSRGKSFTVRATSATDLAGKTVFLVIDSNNDVDEQDEANNLTWQRQD